MDLCFHIGYGSLICYKKFQSDRLYEGKDEKTGTTFITVQPLVADQAYMPQMKAMYVPFHMGYGSLIYSKGLQNDRPK